MDRKKEIEEAAVEHYPRNDSVFQPEILVPAKQRSFQAGAEWADKHQPKSALEFQLVQAEKDLEAAQKDLEASAFHDWAIGWQTVAKDRQQTCLGIVEDLKRKIKNQSRAKA